MRRESETRDRRSSSSSRKILRTQSNPHVQCIEFFCSESVNITLYTYQLVDLSLLRIDKSLKKKKKLSRRPRQKIVGREKEREGVTFSVNDLSLFFLYMQNRFVRIVPRGGIESEREREKREFALWGKMFRAFRLV